MSKPYRVIWVVDVDADNPQDAALQAWQMQHDPDSTATIFDVHTPDEGVVGVDVANHPDWP